MSSTYTLAFNQFRNLSPNLQITNQTITLQSDYLTNHDFLLLRDMHSDGYGWSLSASLQGNTTLWSLVLPTRECDIKVLEHWEGSGYDGPATQVTITWRKATIELTIPEPDPHLDEELREQERIALSYKGNTLLFVSYPPACDQHEHSAWKFTQKS